MAGCTTVPDEETGRETADESGTVSEQIAADGVLTYTNLLGKQVQDDIEEILLSAGIPQNRIEKVFEWIRDFNQCMSGCESYELADEFITVHAPVVDYGDYGPMSRMWFKTNQRDYGDVLCRIAAFQLLQDSIAVGNVIGRDEWECFADTQWLYSDWDAISGHPLIDFSDDEQSKYFTLFNPVVIKEGCSPTEMYNGIVDAWEKRAVVFDKSQASLITVWTQEGNKTAVAHAAVLVEYADGLLLFEKTNPQSPYQVTKLSSIDQVKQYMYDSIYMEAVRYGYEVGPYVVMQNNHTI